MAKKKDKKAKGKKGSGPADTVEAVRSAVERALPEGSKERGSQIVDEVARAVTRVRESLEDHGIFDDLKGLRTEIESLARRVGALERPGAASAKPAATRTTTKRAASKRASTKSSRSGTKRASSRSTTKKPSSSRSTAKRSTTRKAASSRRTKKRASSTKKPSSSS
jgi:hypothetical protein